MKCSDYSSLLWREGSLDDILSDQYWIHNEPDPIRTREYLLECARLDGIVLEDAETYDYVYDLCNYYYLYEQKLLEKTKSDFEYREE